MKVIIVAVGQRQPVWADAAVQDYLDRFPSDFKVQVKQVKAETRRDTIPLARVLSAEAARIAAAVPNGAQLIALDERGSDWTTAQLADRLQRWRDAAEEVAFAIGGADGLDEGLKKRAHMRVRLSSMTLPHALARVVLIEQLYRAWSMLAGHPYHRA
jgi:23S rRNA (pseudouridine1915-N3)-methyltransferase